LTESEHIHRINAPREFVIIKEREINTIQDTTLGDAVALYLANLSREMRQESQQELSKFVRWYGNQRRMAELSGHSLANYAESMVVAAPNADQRLEPLRAFLLYAKKTGLTEANMAVHLRVKKSGSAKESSKQPRHHAAKSHHLTPEGYAQLKAELEGLKAERPRIAEDLRRARADKDFRENAPLDAARDHQGRVEARIRELEAVVKAAVIVAEEQNNGGEIALGTTVHLRDLQSEQQLRYTLVGSREANLREGKISVESPTGRVLLGKANGDIVEVVAPAGTLRYRIEKVER